MDVIRRIYDDVAMGLLALLSALIICFVIFVVPNLSKARAEFEAQRALEIAAENRRYCKKWGMRAETQAHAACLLDLQQFRRDIERRVAEEQTMPF